MDERDNTGKPRPEMPGELPPMQRRSVERGLDQAKRREFVESPMHDRREAETDRRVESRRAEDAPQVASDATVLAELRALASTVRTAQRNGHPDAAKHLEALLAKLGA